jgi:polyhydroxyalkanoate synthase
VAVKNFLDMLDTERVEETVRRAQTSLERLTGGGAEAPSRTPSEILISRPQLTLRHYGPAEPNPGMSPVLLVPPLAASATVYDLRPGYSLVHHLAETGRPTYLADYGRISARYDQDLGLEHWVTDVLPAAIEEVSQREGGASVHLIAWSLGGHLSVGTAANQPDLPIASITAVGSPFDFDVSPALVPLRLARQVTNGRVMGNAIRVVGATPRQVNMLAFYATDPIRQLTKPYFRYRNRHDEDLIAHIDAIDALMDRMSTYPGRTLAQLYHRFVIHNEIARGQMTLGEHVVSLSEVRVPVLLVAGTSDAMLGPRHSVFHGEEIMPNAEVQTLDAPGGHVGVLTGRSAPSTSWAAFDEFMASQEG